jgi:hypothetical protein
MTYALLPSMSCDKPFCHTHHKVRVSYVTAGSLGLGHLVRGLAIGRALERIGWRGSYEVLAPTPSWHIKSLPTRAPVHFSASRDRYFKLLGADLVIIDMFPRLAAELPDGMRSWLLMHKCRPSHWERNKQYLKYFERSYVIEPFSTGEAMRHLSPIVFLDPSELMDRSDARDLLGIGAEERVCVAITSGKPEESLWTSHDLPLGFDRYIAARPDLDFPLDWLAIADYVVSAAGYNTYWEWHWHGLPAVREFRPVRRLIDDQHWRKTHCEHIAMMRNGADQLAWDIVAAFAVANR